MPGEDLTAPCTGTNVPCPNDTECGLGDLYKAKREATSKAAQKHAKKSLAKAISRANSLGKSCQSCDNTGRVQGDGCKAVATNNQRIQNGEPPKSAEEMKDLCTLCRGHCTVAIVQGNLLTYYN